MSEASDYPVVLEPDGNIKLKTEKMVRDQLYHCISDGKVFLFFKDNDDMLNCYEIEEREVVDAIKERPSDIEEILKSYSSAEASGQSDKHYKIPR